MPENPTTAPSTGDDAPSGSSAGFMDRYLDYLAARDNARLAQAARMWAALDPVQQQLVKEAAVLGWVLGVRHHDVPIPNNRDLVVKLLDASTSFADLYPTLAALADQPDGTKEEAEEEGSVDDSPGGAGSA